MRKLTILFNFLFFLTNLFSQKIKIDTSQSANDLIDKILVGKGMRVGNVKLSGLKSSICHFKTDSNIIGMKGGVLLSTGNVFHNLKANVFPGTSGLCSDLSKSKFKSDVDLNKLCKGKTYDQIILDFDFVPFHNNVTFNFAFASEEYIEYVGSRYNDVFAFIVTGEDIKKRNIALIPNTNIPITINNLNHKNHREYFINNDYFLNYGISKKKSKPQISLIKKLWNSIFNKENHKEGYFILQKEKEKLNQLMVSNIEFDGITKVLKTSCILEPWKLYHLKIALGDVGDQIFDSGVFLEENSFSSFKDSTADGFKDYPNLYDKIDWEEIFGHKKVKQDSMLSKIDSIIEAIETVNIFFDKNKNTLSDTARQNLNRLSIFLKQQQKYKLQLFAHTDNTGTKKHNQKLSEKRANEIIKYLTNMGLIDSKMTYLGISDENEKADNTDEQAKALNRKIEITMYLRDDE
jgi:outer membrane protein OmpA-like peptidoglycan-associated protein